MELLLKRIISDNDATLGILYVNGRAFCGVVEDEFRTKKVCAETRIPQGTYEITLRNAGGMTQRYHARFPDMHRGMLHLQNVPYFKYVYIHIGNTDDDSAGCLLVNFSIDFLEMRGSKSKDAYVMLYKQIIAALDKGKKVFITIKDEDR